MSLTDTAVRNARPREKAYKLFDERGLYLEVVPAGGKRWRLKYRHDGKEKRISLGIYPDVSLRLARDRRDEARQMVTQGIDPSASRQAIKAAKFSRHANSLEVITREWFDRHAPTWVPSYSKRLLRLFERDIFPWLGERTIHEITPPQLLSVLRRIEQRGAVETAHRAVAHCGQIFRYAISTGRAERDISQDLRGALPPVKGDHLAAVIDPEKLGELLRMISSYNYGTLVVSCAIRLTPLLFVRPGELRHAEWKDIDLDASEWRFIASKTHTQHIVPLASQAVNILNELRPLTGSGRFVFPSARSASRPMSDNAVLAAFRRMGIPKEETTGHGFRATARTLLAEVLHFPEHIIEHQLAHRVRDPHGRAYNRTTFLEERRKMMQAWANYLDELKGEEG